MVNQSPRAVLRHRILTGARELFRAEGVRSVTMADVAHRADCSRQLVYKVFFDRRELVQAAAVERISEIANAATAAPSTAFADAFVDLSVRVIEDLRNDPELSALLAEGSPVTLHEALWAPELVDRALEFWQPWLELGRTQQLLRTDLPDNDLADWLHTVYASIILRRNIPSEDERSMIERFVLTSLTMARTDAPD